MKQQLEIPVELVRVGLYVSRLDRSWLGTPFLFQGFEISSEEEVQQLRGLCKKVEVVVSGEEADRLLAAGATLRATAATGMFPALVPPVGSEVLDEVAEDPSVPCGARRPPTAAGEAPGFWHGRAAGAWLHCPGGGAWL